jgi:hypothetical protein
MAELNIVRGLTPKTETPKAVLVLTADELRTIWFALDKYKDVLLKDALADVTIEDQAFTLGAAAEIARLQFDIRDNHDNRDGFHDEVVAFLDV